MRVDEELPTSVQLMLPIFHHHYKDFAGNYTAEKGYANVVFDVHCYQVFGDPYAGWRHLSLAQHLRFAAASSAKHDARCIADLGGRVVVTEFSLALPTWHHTCDISWEYEALSKAHQTLLRRSFALRQLRAFAKYTEGWFFWSWRDDSGPEWSFSESSARGWMPALKGSVAGPLSTTIPGASSSENEDVEMSTTPCRQVAHGPSRARER